MKLTNKDISIFKQLVRLNEKILLKTLKTFLINKYGNNNVVANEKFVYAIGTIPIALVAHVDTVFTYPPKNIFYDSQKKVMWSSEGLGADDRAGVFAIIKIIMNDLRPHVIFTTDEELGSIGANALTLECPEPFAEMKYIIQLDRRGYNDCVFYECHNKDFEDYIASFGFIKARGSFSDISELCPAWGIAGVNLSIGYYNEHSTSEIFCLEEFLAVLNKVIKMLKSANEALSFNYIRDTNFKRLWFSEDIIKCDKCKKDFNEYEMFLVKCKNSEKNFYCPECVAEYVEWCEECGDAFELVDNEKICWECKKKDALINVGVN